MRQARLKKIATAWHEAGHVVVGLSFGSSGMRSHLHVQIGPCVQVACNRFCSNIVRLRLSRGYGLNVLGQPANRLRRPREVTGFQCVPQSLQALTKGEILFTRNAIY
jgi:hypothetical protein